MWILFLFRVLCSMSRFRRYIKISSRRAALRKITKFLGFSSSLLDVFRKIGRLPKWHSSAPSFWARPFCSSKLLWSFLKVCTSTLLPRLIESSIWAFLSTATCWQLVQAEKSLQGCFIWKWTFSMVFLCLFIFFVLNVAKFLQWIYSVAMNYKEQIAIIHYILSVLLFIFFFHLLFSIDKYSFEGILDISFPRLSNFSSSFYRHYYLDLRKFFNQYSISKEWRRLFGISRRFRR